MQLTTFAVVFVILTARACRANIVLATSAPKNSTSNIVEAVVNIVTSCYGDRIKGIGLAGNLPETLFKTLSVQHMIPTALIGNSYKYVKRVTRVNSRFRHKLHVFIVEASSFTQLDTLIAPSIKTSKGWHHMSSFFILDMSDKCNISHEYVYIAWQRDILNAKVLCCHRENGTIIFDYNPFTSQAPISWRQFMVFQAIQTKQPFTVFTRAYRGTKAICTDLNFEKTKYLGGFPIHVNGPDLKGLEATHTKSNHGEYLYFIKIKRLFDSLVDVLNANVKFTGFENAAMNGSREDIQRRPMWLDGTGYEATDVYEQIQFVLVTQFRGHRTQLDKILSVIDRYSRYGMIIVYLVTLIFFKLFVHQALVPAILNLIRITCNTGFTNLPGNTASRIYLGCLLFFVVTMQGIYQGNLASLLTQAIPLPNVNTFQDLVDFGYKEICISPELKTIIFNETVFKHQLIKLDIFDCFRRVKHNPLTAYYGFGHGTVLDLTRQYKLHMSRGSLTPTYLDFIHRADWPLHERINGMIGRFVEADLFESWAAKANPIKLTDFEFDETVKNNEVFKKIELGELAFAFVILAIGLSCATVTFIIELATKYTCGWRCALVIVRP